VLILAEPLTFGTIVGFGLIVVGCALSTGVIRDEWFRSAVNLRRSPAR
jgi:hypothetical protein